MVLVEVKLKLISERKCFKENIIPTIDLNLKQIIMKIKCC